jgi:hypothetical protein
MKFAELMVQITPAQMRILDEACREATKLEFGDGKVSSRPIMITPEKMVQITGTDLNRSAMDVGLLFGFGFLANNFDFSTYVPKQSFDITPTHLAIDLFKLCRMQQGNPGGMHTRGAN